jgi:hypothetical protein
VELRVESEAANQFSFSKTTVRILAPEKFVRQIFSIIKRYTIQGKFIGL